MPFSPLLTAPQGFKPPHLLTAFPSTLTPCRQTALKRYPVTALLRNPPRLPFVTPKKSHRACAPFLRPTEHTPACPVSPAHGSFPASARSLQPCVYLASSVTTLLKTIHPTCLHTLFISQSSIYLTSHRLICPSFPHRR